MPGDEGQQLLGDLLEGELRHRHIEVPMNEVRHVHLQSTGLLMAPQLGQVHEGPRGRGFVELRDGDNQPPEMIPLPLRQEPHLPEVDEAELGAGEDEQVSRMGICMEEPMDEDLLEHEVAQSPRQPRPQRPVRLVHQEPAHLLAVHELHHQQPTCALRDPDPREPKVRFPNKLTLEPLQVPGLHREVEFPKEVASQLLNQGTRLPGTRLLDLGLQQLGQTFQDVQIGLHGPTDVRTLDLDHHPLPSPQPGPMNLRDGGRTDRLLVDLREDIRHRPLQLRLNHPSNRVEWQGGDRILKPHQLLEELGRHQTRAAGENLARLHEGRPEFLECPPKFLGLGEIPHRVRLGPQPTRRKPHQARQMQAQGQVLVAVLQEHRHDFT